MEYVYATTLLHDAETCLTSETLTRTLETAGVGVDQSRIDELLSALEGIDLDDVIGPPSGGMTHIWAGYLLDEAGTEINEDTLTETLKAAEADVDPRSVEVQCSVFNSAEFQKESETETEVAEGDGPIVQGVNSAVYVQAVTDNLRQASERSPNDVLKYTTELHNFVNEQPVDDAGYESVESKLAQMVDRLESKVSCG